MYRQSGMFWDTVWCFSPSCLHRFWEMLVVELDNPEMRRTSCNDVCFRGVDQGVVWLRYSTNDQPYGSWSNPGTSHFGMSMKDQLRRAWSHNYFPQDYMTRNLSHAGDSALRTRKFGVDTDEKIDWIKEKRNIYLYMFATCGMSFKFAKADCIW